MSVQLNLDVNEMVHIVQKGETLYGIAKIYKTTYQKLAQYNEISAPYSLKIGQVLNLIQVYDEQIELLNIDNNPLGSVNYILYLENGSEIIGTTNDKGFTKRVITNMPIKIFKLEFIKEEC